MKSYFVSFILSLTLLASFSIAETAPRKSGEMIVQLKKGANVQSLTKDFQTVNFRLKRLLSRRLNIWLVEYDTQQLSQQNAIASAPQLLSLARSHSAVQIAQFNHLVELRSTFPNDPHFDEQWALHNVGQTNGKTDADVDAPETWDFSTGGFTALGDEIIVAVIDDGFDLNHEDLSFWKNEHEISGNGLDDDHNGYVDDYDGWDAVNHDGTLKVETHGTHVSGIVAAEGNNNIGVSGINWNVKIMPIMGASSSEATVIEAYGYALEMRARFNETNGDSGALVVVTNTSFGLPDGTDPSDHPMWCAMYDSLGNYGVLSCAATTNSNLDIDLEGDVPTGCSSDYLISVTNTTDEDQKNISAGYGEISIDLGAPGTNILSTNYGDRYSSLSGTSMSTPLVAGGLSLLYSAARTNLIQSYKNDPMQIALLFKDFIMNGTDSIPDLQNKTVTGGRLNVFNSLMLVRAFADSLDPNPPTDITAYSDYTMPQEMQLSWNDPVHYAGGDTLMPTDFRIMIEREGVLIDSVDGGNEQFPDDGLTDGVLYEYNLYTKIISTDSVSVRTPVRWIAGGAATPNPPIDFKLVRIDSNHLKAYWKNPIQNIDGTPMDDLDGIRIYEEGILFTEFSRMSSDTGRSDSMVFIPDSGYHNYYLTAVDNEPASNESGPSNMAFTPLNVPFFEEFVITPYPNTTYWNNKGGLVSDQSIDPPSPPYAMMLDGHPDGGDTLTMKPLDLSDFKDEDLVLSYWFQPEGEGDVPEEEDSLYFEIRDSSDHWIKVREYPGIKLQPFKIEILDLDSLLEFENIPVFHSQFQIRFGNKATPASSHWDQWFIDNIYLGKLRTPKILISLDTLSDTLLAGGTSEQSFSIKNNQILPSYLNYKVNKLQSADWLTILPDSGNLISKDSAIVKIQFIGTDLSPGVYETQLEIAENVSQNLVDTIDVKLIVRKAPVLSTAIDSLSFKLVEGQQDSVSFTIRNEGSGTLNFSIEDEDISIDPKTSQTFVNAMKRSVTHRQKAQNTNLGTVMVNSAGPDSLGYRWIDSNDSTGPAYQFTDISTTGEIAELQPYDSYPAKDEGVASVQLPFNIYFYGNVYNQLLISSNGFVTFDMSFLAESYYNEPIPSSAIPNSYIAPFWDDLDGKAEGEIYKQHIGNKFIVQWHNWGHYDNGTELLIFQLVLFQNSSTFWFVYEQMDQAQHDATIGIENQDATTGLQISYELEYAQSKLLTQVIRDALWLSVLHTTDSIPPNEQTNINLMLDASEIQTGEYLANIIVTSNDPLQGRTKIPVSLTVFDSTKIANFTSPDTIVFDTTYVDSISSNDLIVSNYAVDTLLIGNITTTNPAFLVDTTKIVINRNTEFALDVQFSPQEGGHYEAWLVLDSNHPTIPSDSTLLIGMAVEPVAIHSPAKLPKKFAVSQNFPNPFNPTTVIKYQVPKHSEVNLEIYNVLGQKVRTLIDSEMKPGYYEVQWNGLNNVGNPVGSGIYIYKFRAGDYTKVMKMIYMK